MTEFRITAKSVELGYKLALENPCQVGSPEFDVWVAWAWKGVCGDPEPTQNDVPAAHEGYEWGVAFNKNWH